MFINHVVIIVLCYCITCYHCIVFIVLMFCVYLFAVSTVWGTGENQSFD